MPRTKSSRRWLARNARDEYVKRARREGARSRAIYKIEEIDKRDHLLRSGMTVVDLGAAPGGWSQYVKSRVGASGRVLAVDVLPMEPIPGVEFLEGDFTEQPVLDWLIERLQGHPVDLVISDMAPNMTGVPSVDQARSMEMAELALDFASQTLKSGGAVLVKIFQGSGFNEFYAQMRHQFAKIGTRKPQASRSESREIYLLGKGFKGN